MLGYWNNSLSVDMLLYSDELSSFLTNQSLLSNDSFLSEMLHYIYDDPISITWSHYQFW
jgi:hypothetical protein